MNAFNHKSGLTIVVLVTLLAIAGCQAAPTPQPNAIPTTGCQPTPTPQPAATPVPPTASPMVVAEGEKQCTLMNMEGIAKGLPVVDPVLGEGVSAEVNSFELDCGNPYVTYKCVQVYDSHGVNLTSFVECITNEGGVWKGTCQNSTGERVVCTNTGDAKYKGLQLFTDAEVKTFIMKYRVTKATEE